MLAISDEEKAAWLSPSRQLAIRVSMLNTVYDNDSISSMNFDSGSISGETYQIGSTYMNTVKLVFPTIVESVKEDVELSLSLGVLIGDKYSYVKLGIFYVTEFDRDRNSNQTTVTASDKMIYMEGSYNSKLKYPAQYRDVALEIANLAGVEVDVVSFQSLGTGTIAKPEGYTHRQAIGLIAQFEGGFASFNREGKLEIRRLRPTDFTVSPENYLLKGFKKNENSYRIGGITAKIGNDEEDTLYVGSLNGSQVELENKVMTQILLNKTWDLVKSLNYFPFELKWQGCPALEAGDWFYVKDKNGTRYSVPNLSYSFNFAGGLVAESKAITNSASQATYRYKGPLHQKIDNIDALLSANNWNSNYYDQTEPTNPKEGDIWFKPNGQDTEIWIYEKDAEGNISWVLQVSTAPDPELIKVIEEVGEKVEQAQSDADQALTGANDAVSKANEAAAKADASGQAAQLAIEQSVNALSDATDALENAKQAQEDATKALDDITNLDTVNLLPNSTWNIGQGTWTVGFKGRYEILQPEEDKTSSNILHGFPLAVATQHVSNLPHPIYVEAGQHYALAFDFKELNYSSSKAIFFIRVFPEKNSQNTSANALWSQSLQHATFGIKSNVSQFKRLVYTFVSPVTGWMDAYPCDSDESGMHETFYREIMLVKSSMSAKSWSPYPGDVKIQIDNIDGELSQKVSQATFDVLSQTVVNQATQINQNATDIAIKANQSTVDNLAGRVTEAEAAIDVNAKEIKLKASQTSFDTLNNAVESVQSELKVEAGKISALNTLTDGHTTQIGSLQTGYDGLSNTVSVVQNDLAGKASVEQFSNLTQRVDSIQSTVADKANQSQVIQLADQITSVVTELSTTKENLIRNADFKDGTSFFDITGADSYEVIKNNGAQPFTSDYLRITRLSTNTASSSWYTQISNASSVHDQYAYNRVSRKKWMLSGWYYIQNVIVGSIKIYCRVTLTDGTFKYFNNSISYTHTGNAWMKFAFPIDLTLINGITDIRFAASLADAKGGNIYFAEFQFESGEKVTSFTTNRQDNATQSQITQLFDQINLRVTKDDVVNQINISPDSVLISANKIQITGETYIQDGTIKTAHIANAAITDAKIGNISANKITTGQLNAANVNIINLNASNITTGTLRGITLSSTSGEGLFTVTGSDATFQNPSGYTRINSTGLSVYTSSGALRGEMNLQLVNSAAFGTINTNVYLGAYEEIRCVNYNSIPGDGAVDSYRYIAMRASQLYAQALDVGHSGGNLYLRMTYGNEARITTAGSTGGYNAVRAYGYYGDFLCSNTLTGSENLYLQPTGEVRITGSANLTAYRNLRAANLFANALDINGGTNIYVRPSSGGELRVSATGTTTNYVAVRASAFNTSSLAEYKTNINPFDQSALDLIKSSTIYEYNLKTDLTTKEIGLVIGEGYQIADIVVNGDGVSQYRMSSLAWKAIQELNQKIETLEKEIRVLQAT
ncbi:tail fiber domain-containing protein [Enterococcus thailandicus]